MSEIGEGFNADLNQQEKEQVETFVPMNQARIHLSFRANLALDGRFYDNSAVAISEHMITFCYQGFLGWSLKLLKTYHFFAIVEVMTLDNETVQMKIGSNAFVIRSPVCMKFVRILLRNFILCAPLMPASLRFSFSTHDISLFPPFMPHLSPSQMFQLTYNTNCSFYETTYHHAVVQYFHRFIHEGTGIFDCGRLPIQLTETGLGDYADLRAITASLGFAPFVYGFNCEGAARVDVVRACASLLLNNENIKFLRLVDIGAQDGCAELVRAMCSSHPGVVYWDFSENRLEDISHFCRALGSYTAQLIGLKLTNCQMDGFALTLLLNSLVDNEYLHSIKQVCLSGNTLRSSHCEQMTQFLRKIAPKEELNLLEIGPITSPTMILDVLADDLKFLRALKLVDTTLKDSDMDFVNFLSLNRCLEKIELSGCKISEMLLMKALEAVSGNTSITAIQLGLNRMKINNDLLASVLGREGLHQKITALYLDENGLTPQDLHVIVQAAGNMPKLKELSLSGNFSNKVVETADRIAELLTITTLETLVLKGSQSCQAGEAMFPFLELLPVSQSLRRVDISYNKIGSKGVGLVAAAIKQSKILTSIRIDGSQPSELEPILDLLSTAANSTTIMELQFPTDDIYMLLVDLEEEVKQRSFDIVGHLQEMVEERIVQNRSNAGFRSGLLSVDDPYLNHLLDTCVAKVQMKLSEIPINRHLPLAELLGLPFPFESYYTVGEHSMPVNDDLDREELPVTERLSLGDPIQTIQYRSLVLRSPDFEFTASEYSQEEEEEEEDTSDDVSEPPDEDALPLEDLGSDTRRRILPSDDSQVMSTVPLSTDVL